MTIYVPTTSSAYVKEEKELSNLWDEILNIIPTIELQPERQQSKGMQQTEGQMCNFQNNARQDSDPS